VQVGELHLDSMSELSLCSLRACVEVRNISREGEAEATPVHSRQTSGGFGSHLVFEQDLEISSCEESDRDEKSREM